jgi:hypothetical protein
MSEMLNVMRVKRTREEAERDFDMLRKWFSLKEDKFGDRREEEFILSQRARIGLERFKLPGDEEAAVRRAMQDAKRLPLGLHKPEWMEMLERSKDSYAAKGVPFSMVWKDSAAVGAHMDMRETMKKRWVFK